MPDNDETPAPPPAAPPPNEEPVPLPAPSVPHQFLERGGLGGGTVTVKRVSPVSDDA
jgi:hypothetical protein